MTKSEKLQIGHLYQDKHKFKKGYYIYVGSAMNSLIGRINRHLSDDKKMHWHIDYLLKSENANVKDVIFNISDEKIECQLACEIAKEGEEILGFGCSDCNCKSHLIYFKTKRCYQRSPDGEVPPSFIAQTLNASNADTFDIRAHK